MDLPSEINASGSDALSFDDSGDEEADKRVTIWNWKENRKLSGNSAPFKKNLQEYLEKNPEWEAYIGQDMDENGRKKYAPRKRKFKDVRNGSATSTTSEEDTVDFEEEDLGD